MRKLTEMNTFEKLIRSFADMVGTVLGQVYFDSEKNAAPLWLAIFMSILGVVAIMLFMLAILSVFV